MASEMLIFRWFRVGQELHEDGTLYDLTGYLHPAQQARVLFVQEPPGWRCT